MMGMGSELVEPGLTPDQELNGEMISRIFPQRTVWLLPNQVLSRRTPDIRVNSISFIYYCSLFLRKATDLWLISQGRGFDS